MIGGKLCKKVTINEVSVFHHNIIMLKMRSSAAHKTRRKIYRNLMNSNPHLKEKVADLLTDGYDERVVIMIISIMI